MLDSNSWFILGQWGVTTLYGSIFQNLKSNSVKILILDNKREKNIFKCLLPHTPVQESVVRQLLYKFNILLFISSLLSQIIAMLLDDVLTTRYLIENKAKYLQEVWQKWKYRTTNTGNAISNISSTVWV